MRGWLIVNPFLDTKKFREIYEMLCASARAEGIRLDMKTTVELMCPSGDDFSGFALPDFALFWDKDVYLARRLERAGLRLFNSAAAVEACDNKVLTAMALAAAQVPTPLTFFSPKTFEGVGYSSLGFLDTAAERLGYPLVIKEAYGSFGMQVYLAENREEAEKRILSLGSKDLVLQQFIANSRGRDIRVNVVGGRVVASMLRYNDADFRSNITNGGQMKGCTITPAQEAAALRACEALGLDFAGVDVLFGEGDTPLICEVNSNPHFKSTLQATGVDVSRPMMQHIRKVITCGD